MKILDYYLLANAVPQYDFVSLQPERMLHARRAVFVGGWRFYPMDDPSQSLENGGGRLYLMDAYNHVS